MIRLAIRDLQWHRRRYAIVVLVASLAFGLALLMSGVAHQMAQEGRNTVALFAADEWVVADGVGGPFTSSQLVDAALLDEVAARPGVSAASPILIGRTTVGSADVNVVGYDPASPILPAKIAAARASADDPDGVIADVTLGPDVGESVVLAGVELPVVATVKDTGFYFSSPTVFLPMPLVQDLLFTGENVASAIMVRGDVGLVDDSGLMGVSVRTNEQVLADFDRILQSSNQTLGTISTLLWVMAAGIVGAIVYVSVLERTRDLATLKAIGARSSSLVGGLVAQSSLIALISAVASVGVCRALAPSFGFPVTVPSSAYTQLVVVAAVVGVLASLTGVRKITRIDPALAFGGAS